MSAIEAAKYAKTKLSSMDILASILAIARKSYGIEEFRAHDHTLQEIFLGLEEEYEFPLLLEYFVFPEDDLMPHSRQLSSAVSSLQLAGLINRLNPSYQMVLVNPESEDYHVAVVDAFLDDSQREQLERIAEAFARKVGSE